MSQVSPLKEFSMWAFLCLVLIAPQEVYCS